MGIEAQIGTDRIMIGNRRMVGDVARHAAEDTLEAQGNTVVWVRRNDTIIGLIALADTVRPDVAAALAQLRERGIGTIEMLTGDNEPVAATLATTLGIRYRANLLPEDKIAAVRQYQAAGHRVVMIGDGVNDAPALAQAHVGIAMGVAGSDVAIEAAHIALMRDDWALIPDVLALAQRTMRVVKTNIGFTALYNVVGLTLAALGILPPVFAAAAQSLPDLGIMANSARLLRIPTSLPISAPGPLYPTSAATPCTDGCCETLTISSIPSSSVIALDQRQDQRS